MQLGADCTIGLAQGVGDESAAIDEGGRVSQPLLLLLERIPFALDRGDAREFIDLPAQTIAFEGHLALAAFDLFDLALDAAPACMSLGKRGELGGHAGITIEQGTLSVGAQHGLRGMLAMHFDQHLAQFAKLRRGRRMAVDECP